MFQTFRVLPPADLATAKRQAFDPGYFAMRIPFAQLFKSWPPEALFLNSSWFAGDQPVAPYGVTLFQTLT